MIDTSTLVSDLGRAITARDDATRRIAELRQEIRSSCEHPIVIESNGPSYFPQRVCISCGTGEIASLGSWRFLGHVGQVVKTNGSAMPGISSPNVEVQFFSWCRAGHQLPVRLLSYGWCGEHLPADIRAQIARYDCEQDRLNTPG